MVILSVQVMVIELAEGAGQVESAEVEFILRHLIRLATEGHLELVSIAGDPSMLLGEHRQQLGALVMAAGQAGEEGILHWVVPLLGLVGQVVAEPGQQSVVGDLVAGGDMQLAVEDAEQRRVAMVVGMQTFENDGFQGGLLDAPSGDGATRLGAERIQPARSKSRLFSRWMCCIRSSRNSRRPV